MKKKDLKKSVGWQRNITVIIPLIAIIAIASRILLNVLEHKRQVQVRETVIAALANEQQFWEMETETFRKASIRLDSLSHNLSESVAKSHNYKVIRRCRKNLAELGFVIVLPGDCLWNLSKHLSGNGFKWHPLYAWNIPEIGYNPHLIQPWKVLKLPDSTSTWTIELQDQKEGGWVVEFARIDTTLRFFVSVGFNEKGKIKFALNAIDVTQPQHVRGHWIDGMFMFAPEDLVMFEPHFYIDHDMPGYAHRYVDAELVKRTNWLPAPIPPGLPTYIPIEKF